MYKTMALKARHELSAGARFERLFADHYRPVLGYLLRRTRSAEDAADIAAEVLLVAWRRLDDVPSGPEAKLWMYGVARRTLANWRRSADRRTRLVERLSDQIAASITELPEQHATASDALRLATEALSAQELEIVHLTAWEGLSPGQASRVLNVAAPTARTRLRRARMKMRAVLDQPPDIPDDCGLRQTSRPTDTPTTRGATT